jgi:hypothetical protein
MVRLSDWDRYRMPFVDGVTIRYPMTVSAPRETSFYVKPCTIKENMLSLQLKMKSISKNITYEQTITIIRFDITTYGIKCR